MKFFTIITASLLLSSTLFAQQNNDSLRFNANISAISTVGTTKDQSFWLTHNRWGMFDDASANGLILLSTSYRVNNEKLFSIGGGIDLVARASSNSSAYIQQGYVEAKLGFMHFEAGRKQTTYGITFSDLSSGSLAISNNSIPIPRIVLSVPDFYDVPFTAGLLEFRGHFAHGWLDNSRYVKDAFFHDKSFHIQAGGDIGIKAYWGLTHIAIWGGNSPVHGKLPATFSDFLRVMMAKEGSDGSPANEVNALGFHTGVFDWGVKAKIGRSSLHAYYQHPFTDRSGQTYRNKLDGLWGLGIMDPFPTRVVTEILYEFLYTMHQSGAGLSDIQEGDQPDFCDQPNCGYPYGGRDNYYNNSMYRSGHSYLGMSLGSPFFMTQEQLDKINPDINTYSSVYFVSTRNIAHHFAVKGEVASNLSYKLFASYVRYYGTYTGLNMGQLWGSLDPTLNQEDYFFNPAQKQWYFMLETRWTIKNIDNITFSSTLAVDKGQLFNNASIMLGLSWNINR